MLAAVAGLAVLSLGSAQGFPGWPPDDKARAVWTLFEERQELSLLIDVCSVVLEVGIDYDPALVQGEVIARTPSKVSAMALWDVANRALAQRGLTSVQVPGSEVLSVVALDAAPRLARVEQGGIAHTRAGFLKVLVPLEHAEPEKIAEAVRVALSKDAALTPLRDSRSLVIADFRAHVEQALTVLQLLDAAMPGAVQVEDRTL